METEESETMTLRGKTFDSQKPEEGDRVTVEFDADLVKLYDDGSADVDADALDLKIWPDELLDVHPEEGDRVTVRFDADLVELFDDGSATVDADGIEIPVWPDEVLGVGA